MLRGLFLPEDLREFARGLRREQTDAESLLWQALRGRRFAKMKFRRQCPVDPYVLDFYCHDARLAIELDGGQHNGAEARGNDDRRTEQLAKRGIHVPRFWNHEVFEETEAVFEAIYRELLARAPAACSPSPPAPLPKGEGRTQGRGE